MSQPYIFMSHSSLDHDFTARLAERLHVAGFRCWVDVEDIPDGSTWMREIEQAVMGCGALMVIMSKNGRESEWVERETLMAMELRKPIFIARIDDAPLPIHLINRQYTDFRARPEAAFKKLIAALSKTLLAESPPQPAPDQPKKQSPDPNRLNFFKYMEQLPNGVENARVARALYEWAKRTFDSIAFSGRREPAFLANLSLGPGGVTVFSVRAYSKQPAVELSLQFLTNFPPYEDRARRLAVLHALNRWVDVPFDDSRADRRPNLPLAALADDTALQAFIELIGGIVAALREATPETPDQP